MVESDGQWIYTGHEPMSEADLEGMDLSAAPPRKGKTLVVLDFDCTITRVHMYYALTTPEGRAALQSDADEFYGMIFGGEERIRALRDTFARLADGGATLRVMSFGSEAQIRAALAHLDLARVVEQVHGRASYAERGFFGRAAKQQLLASYLTEEGRAWEHVVFVDDDRENYPRSDRAGGDPNDRIQKWDTWHYMGTGVPEHAAHVTLHAYPPARGKDGGGLDAQEMDGLVFFQKVSNLVAAEG